MINPINVEELSQVAIIIAIGVVGLTQFLKNFFAAKKGKCFASSCCCCIFRQNFWYYCF